jgi:four helix bundle protein
MATLTDFRELVIWNLARKQCQHFDRLVRTTPLGKDYNLRNQMNGSSGSVMDNIAEGFEREGNQEFINFLIIALASNAEFLGQLVRCLDREYITETEFSLLESENLVIKRKTKSLIKYLNGSDFRGFNRKKP